MTVEFPYTRMKSYWSQSKGAKWQHHFICDHKVVEEDWQVKGEEKMTNLPGPPCN